MFLGELWGVFLKSLKQLAGGPYPVQPRIKAGSPTMTAGHRVVLRETVKSCCRKPEGNQLPVCDRIDKLITHIGSMR